MKYALLSGGNSGLAKAATTLLINNGYIVFSLDISNDSNYIDGNIHYLKVDITNNESLHKCKEYISNITDKLDLICNFAGIVLLGSLIESSLDYLSKIIDVNLIGTYKINNLFYSFVKNSNGRIINISSEYGLIDAIPFHTFYPITKHAIEIYNDGLRRELSGQNIKVIAIRPGAFKTNMQQGVNNQFNKLLDETKLYKKPLLKLKFMMDNELKKAKDVSIFVKTFKKAAFNKKPKRYYAVGNSMKMKLLTILPTWLQDYIFKMFIK